MNLTKVLETLSLFDGIAQAAGCTLIEERNYVHQFEGIEWHYVWARHYRKGALTFSIEAWRHEEREDEVSFDLRIMPEDLFHQSLFNIRFADNDEWAVYFEKRYAARWQELTLMPELNPEFDQYSFQFTALSQEQAVALYREALEIYPDRPDILSRRYEGQESMVELVRRISE